ncbi:hypothetical protein [Nostoc sp. 'Peltigera membranacea cyanobiont' 210A]|uniref:hypothetical protein n=1 Tax=Nostoc sp. 'Peltigera membranacea cyanobiont' 210A TaxID=2014529 RepID=UPI0011813EF1|nr:hypothetical protein [Nostoc sp. 'Peltigera membranacea cyanobiont' 210A]
MLRCLRRATPTHSLDNKLGDRIKLLLPQLTIRVLCPNPDDCVLIKLIYQKVRSPLKIICEMEKK